MLLRRNHKSEKSALNAADILKSIDKEVEHGWALLLTIDSTRHIKNGGIAPLGVAKKLSINERGELYTTRRVTHNCSSPGTPGLSINNQLLRDTLKTCLYSF